MYVPAHARKNRTAVLDEAIERIGFGGLVTCAHGEPLVTHLPMRLERSPERTIVTGHLARANPQCRTPDGSAAVATFVGASFYVSPSAYASKIDDGKVVPTWDYIAVEARGTLRCFGDPGRLRPLLARLTRQHEQDRPVPWTMDDAPATYVAAQLRGIVGFELDVASLTGAWKLSFNKGDADRDGVAALAEDAPDVRTRSLAETIRIGRA